MEENTSWDVNWSQVSPVIPRILWNPRVHYRFHKLPPFVPVLRQISLVLVSQSHFLKIYFSFFLPSIHGFSEWSLSHWSPHQSLVFTSIVSYTCRAKFSARLLFLDVIIRKINIWRSLLPASDTTAIYETNTKGRGYLCIFPTENASITTPSAIYVTVA